MEHENQTPWSQVHKWFDAVALRTGEMINDSGMQLARLKLRRSLSHLYQELGKAQYGISAGLPDQQLQTDALVDEITQAHAAYARLCGQLGMAAGKHCPVCGKGHADNAAYCADCGALLS